MRVFRFDADVSVPVSELGSRFRAGPLTGPDSRVQVQVVYVPADGRVARQPASVPRLFAVIGGVGWVSGHDARRRPIQAGQAAWWAAGEDHEVYSPDGLTAICIDGAFEVWSLAVTTDIVVEEYNPDWPSWFESLRQAVWPAVQDVALRIEHVGSTAVPGLAAKPIIDMDIVVASAADVPPVIERLRRIGYRWRGDMGVAGREAFKLLVDDDRPRHHLYLVVENSPAHLDHWLLRDLLRDDAEARERYAALKRRNVQLADGDIEVYVAAKAALVGELLSRARVERGFPPGTYPQA